MDEPSRPPVTLTRQQLYDQVWATPMRKLAAVYGLSDVWLARICDRHDIPRPPRGYWAQKEFGKAPEPEPLPPNDDPELQTIRLSAGEPREPGAKPKPPDPEYDADIVRVLAAARALPPVKIPEAMRSPHPLVAATRQALEGAKPDDHTMVHPRHDGKPTTLSLAVSKECVRRALAYFDVLIKAVDKVGGTVSVRAHQWDHRRRETVVSFCGETAGVIRLRERYKQVKRVKQPQDRWDWRQYDCIPTGRLLLDSGTYGPVHSQDTEKGRRIEDDVNRIIVRWVEDLGRARIERRRQEEERRRRAEEERIRREQEVELQRRRQEFLDKQKEEQARVSQLRAQAAAWRESQVIRDYIRDVERAATERADAPQPGSEAALWLTWARQQADRLDPLTPSLPSILDEST